MLYHVMSYDTMSHHVLGAATQPIPCHPFPSQSPPSSAQAEHHVSQPILLAAVVAEHPHASPKPARVVSEHLQMRVIIPATDSGVRCEAVDMM